MLAGCLLYMQPAYSQQKKTKEINTKPDTGKEKKIRIIYETEPAHERKETEILHLYESKQTTIKVNSGDSSSLPKADTVIFIKAAKANAATDFCNCVTVDIKTPDTLEFGQYINYSFTFKNNCRETVFVYSSGFNIKPYNVFGSPVKVLRKIAFVKRYDLPEFVTLAPKDSFEYRFADDPFFEFELFKSQRYKFVFSYSNINTKHKINPRKTYLCTRKEEQVIFVK